MRAGVPVSSISRRRCVRRSRRARTYGAREAERTAGRAGRRWRSSIPPTPTRRPKRVTRDAVAAVRPARRPGAPRAIAASPAGVRFASVGRRHPAVHGRSCRAGRPALRSALSRARRRRHGNARLATAGEDFVAYFSLPDDLADACRNVARHWRRDDCISSTCTCMPRAILDLPAAACIPYDCTLHDYYAICPQYHLVTAQGRYCGEPDANGCTACLARRPAQWGLDITAWRTLFAASARRRSRHRAVAGRGARIGSYFPDLAVQVWPHPEIAPRSAPRHARRRAGQPVAGKRPARHGRDAHAEARPRDSPLVFRVIGSTTESIRAIAGRSADDLRTVSGRRSAATDRGGEARRHPVRGAGSGNLRLYAVRSARHRAAHRRVGAGRAARAAGRLSPLANGCRGTLRPLERGTARGRRIRRAGRRPRSSAIPADPA